MADGFRFSLKVGFHYGRLWMRHFSGNPGDFINALGRAGGFADFRHRRRYWNRRFGLDFRFAALRGFILDQAAFDVGALLAHFDAHGFDLSSRATRHLDFAVGFPFERDFPGLGHTWRRQVTVTLAQVRQQIQLLFFRDRRIRSSDGNACLGKLLQQTICRYADHRRKLFDRYVRHSIPPGRANPTARSSKTKARAPS